MPTTAVTLKLAARLQLRTLRHAGLAETADAEGTDTELQALSGHKTRAVLARYVRPSTKQAGNAVRKRRAARTKIEGGSESGL